MNKIQEIFNFHHIGKKIKNLTKWSCWITILLIWIAAPIAFVGCLFEEETVAFALLVPIAAIVGSVIVWVGSWTMYAFGELVDSNSKEAEEITPPTSSKKENPVQQKEPAAKPSAPLAAPLKAETIDVLDDDDFFETECPHCGETLWFLEGTEKAECPHCNCRMAFI